MTIAVGSTLPNATFFEMTADGPAPRTTADVFKGRKVVLVGVPGAFTPTCNGNHVPPFVAKAEAIKAKGVDAIAVTGVNDVFVMGAWAKHTGADGTLTFLADGSARFADAIGLTLDLGERGLGTRSQRYAMIVDDGVVRYLAVEDSPAEATKAGADGVLAAL